MKYRKINFPEPVVDVTQSQDGSYLLKSPLALDEYKPGLVLDQINPDLSAGFMFTSGSTGMPKAVIHTHKMICSAIIM